MALKNGKKAKPKKVELKNYISALLIFVGGILLVLYIFEWYQVKQEEKVLNSYLVSTNTVNYVIDDIMLYKQINQEVSNDYFVFIGYTKDLAEYNIEKSFKKIIDNYELNDIVYYINITDLMKNSDYISVINKNLGINIKHVPAIIYIKNGSVAKDGVITGNQDGKLSSNKFEHLLDLYEYEKKK